ncbi:MAG: hypothetical protein LBN22_01710 [Clostridiales Family XIII bacterium]|jgi:hypothetical protein|nr:hypothetical protein [Clostridiales Family XIII bacterium]
MLIISKSTQSFKSIKEKSGSTLVWVLTVSFILAIMLSISFASIYLTIKRTTNTHIDNQAHYTALSITKTMIQWISDANAPITDVDKSSVAFLAHLKLASPSGITIDIPDENLPAKSGTAEVQFKFLDPPQNTKLQMMTTARYADATDTITTTMAQDQASGHDFIFTPPDFDLTQYEDEVTKINSGADGYATDHNPVNIAFNAPNGPNDSNSNYESTTVKRDFNQDNLDRINAIISSSNRTREATWMETSDIGGSNYTSGPRDRPWIGESARDNTSATGPIAKMMLVTPQNGKLMINPVSAGGHNASFSHSLNALTNIKVNLFSISGTTGASLKLRLGDSGTGARKNASNSSHRVIPKFSYIGIDFYDNNTPMQLVKVPNITSEAVTISNPSDVSSGVSQSTVNGIPFYPNTWKDSTIYLKNSSAESIDSELLFGSYGRIHSSYTLDYRGWANYVNYHWGYVNHNMNYMIKPLNITEPLTIKDSKDKSGFAWSPVYWGNHFSMYLLDGAYTPESARIMQGVNIVNKDAGVLYSNRGLKIGGALTIQSTDRTYEGTHTILDGFDGNPNWTSLPLYETSYHQVISNTDIVLKADSTTTKQSEILHPDGIKGFVNRTLTITGGSIYVGDKQELTIDSEIKDGLVVTGEIGADGATRIGNARTGDNKTYYDYTSQGNRMYIQPKQMIVDSGGALTIKNNQNAHYNVETDIYVSGGSLTIEKDAAIKGNIYVYGGGTLDIKGNFRMESPLASKGGIFIMDTGNFKNLSAKSKIFSIKDLSGSLANGAKVHMVGTSFIDNYKKYCPENAQWTATKADLDQMFCDLRYSAAANIVTTATSIDINDAKDQSCLHFGRVAPGGWTVISTSK